MSLKCKILNQKYITVFDKQKENKYAVVDGFLTPLSYTINGWSLTLNPVEFYLDGLLYADDGSVISITPATAIERTDIVVVRKTIAPFTPSGSSETFDTITNVELVYLEGATVPASNEDILLTITVPANAVDLNECTIDSLDSSTKTKDVLDRLKTLEPMVDQLMNGTAPIWGDQSGQGSLDYLAREWARNAIIGQMKQKLEDITATNATKAEIQNGYADTFSDDTNIWYEYTNNVDVFTGTQGYIQPSVNLSNLNATYNGQVATGLDINGVMGVSAFDEETNTTYYIKYQKLFKIQNNVETLLYTLGATNQESYVVLVKEQNKLYMFGANGSNSAVFTYSTFNLITNTYETITNYILGTKPSGRGGICCAYDELTKKIIIYGGYFSYNTLYYNETWQLDPFTLQSSKIATAYTSTTDARYRCLMWYDKITQKIYRFGGQNTTTNSTAKDKTYVLDYSSNTWVEVATTSKPSARAVNSACYITNFGLMMYGGQDMNGATLYDIWLFTGSNWNQITISGTLPQPTGYISFLSVQINGSGSKVLSYNYSTVLHQITIDQLNNNNSVATFNAIQIYGVHEALLWAEGEGSFYWEVSFNNGNNFYPIAHDGTYLSTTDKITDSFTIFRCIMSANSKLYGFSVALI